MGFFEKGADKARARQKDSVIEEAAAAGSQVVEVVDSDDETTATSVVGGILKTLAGGTVKHDSSQVFVLRTRDLLHFYVQPYHGLVAVPGEHHTRISGTLASPTVLRRKFLGRLKWESEGPGDNPFNKNPSLGSAVKALKWEWKAGFTEIELDWTVQLRPTGGGYSHLVMQAGRYGGFTSYKVGIAQFVALCTAIRSNLTQTVDIGPQDFVEPSTYAPVFEKYVQSQAQG